MRVRAAFAAFALWAPHVRAQAPQTFQSEGRIDAFFARTTTVQAAAGGAWALDPNVRVVLLGGLGSTFASGAGNLRRSVRVPSWAKARYGLGGGKGEATPLHAVMSDH